ncbi:MAG: chromosomal replication initiator protein DnaA [Actinobacteria bacterium]|nr:MAG: chromosomal replication initiator protein DnaA [Actinomycetota bacterium]
MQDQLDTIWQQTLDIIKDELNTPTFRTWFENTSPVAMQDGSLVVSTPNDFAKEWLESRYSTLVGSALNEVMGEVVEIKFTVAAGGSTVAVEEEASAASPGESARVPADNPLARAMAPSSLNTKYTFDSFVIGNSNRFAHAAALAVAEKPSQAYNPLFIYGGVGLGKTHLLQAIGHYVRQHFPHLKVRYVSSEKFTNDFINSIRDKDKIVGFQKRYRGNDVLLVDDIQFLENKEATQEEFFHTFNTLHEAGKQIVISSDRPPKDISTLEDRLRSRFEMGLITDIQPPEVETRIAILRKKAQLDQLIIGDDVLEFIASKIQSNIRELEGALIRIIAFSSLTGSCVDLALADEVLKDIFPDRGTQPISVSTIQAEVCRYFGISKVELVGSKRSQKIVYPRQIAMYLTRELTDMSLPKIGEAFGGRDHTTVLHATTKIEKLIRQQRDVYNQIQELTNAIKQKS